MVMAEFVAELAALAAAYGIQGGPDETCVCLDLGELAPIVQQMQAGDEQQAALHTLDTTQEQQPINITIHMSRPLHNSATRLDVHLLLSGSTKAPRCCLTSDNALCVDPGWLHRVQSSLQACVDLAVSQDEPYLFQLTSSLQEALVQRATDLSGTGTGSDSQPETSEQEAQVPVHVHPPPVHTDVLVVRLDHMHNRAMYTRALRAWFSELGITGRCIFYSSSKRVQGAGASGLVLLVLEGEQEQLRKYLVRHRTETVDVDSNGRKCRERMMHVVLQRQQPIRTFDDYCEVDAGGMPEVTDILTSAGLAEHIRLILGISK